MSDFNLKLPDQSVLHRFSERTSTQFLANTQSLTNVEIAQDRIMLPRTIFFDGGYGVSEIFSGNFDKEFSIAADIMVLDPILTVTKDAAGNPLKAYANTACLLQFDVFALLLDYTTAKFKLKLSADGGKTFSGLSAEYNRKQLYAVRLNINIAAKSMKLIVDGATVLTHAFTYIPPANGLAPQTTDNGASGTPQAPATTPAISKASAARYSQNTAKLRFTANMHGIYYYMICASNVAAPTAEQVVAQANYGSPTVVPMQKSTGKTVAHEPCEVDIISLSSNTAYKLYLVLQTNEETPRLSVLTTIAISAAIDLITGSLILANSNAFNKHCICKMRNIMCCEDTSTLTHRWYCNEGVGGRMYDDTSHSAIILYGKSLWDVLGHDNGERICGPVNISSEAPVNSSVIGWAADGLVDVYTSLDKGATWDLAHSGKPIPNLPTHIYNSTIMTKAVLKALIGQTTFVTKAGEKEYEIKHGFDTISPYVQLFEGENVVYGIGYQVDDENTITVRFDEQPEIGKTITLTFRNLIPCAIKSISWSINAVDDSSAKAQDSNNTALIQQALSSHIRYPRAKLEVLDKNEYIIDTIEADLIEGSMTIEAQNGSRRSASFTVSNISKKYTPGRNNLIWFTTKLRLSTGYRINGVDYFVNRGVFVLPSNSINSIGGRVANITAVDKWALLDGTLGGTLDSDYIIDVGTPIADAIRAVLAQSQDIRVPVIDDIKTELTTPYTITIEAGGTYADALTTIASMISYDVFYDRNGYLRFQNPETVKNQLPIWIFDKDDVNYKGGTLSHDFSKLKNHIVVRGDNINGKQVRGEATDNNAFSDTCVAKIGYRTQMIDDDVINTDELANQRAEYELKNKVMLYESLDLESVLIDLIDEDSVVQIDDEWLDIKRGRYLVRSVNISINECSMTISTWRERDLKQINPFLDNEDDEDSESDK